MRPFSAALLTRQEVLPQVPSNRLQDPTGFSSIPCEAFHIAHAICGLVHGTSLCAASTIEGPQLRGSMVWGIHMQSKLITAFSSLREADFLARAQQILASLTGNAHFPEPWAVQVPNLADLGTAFAAYQTAYGAAQSGDKAKIAARQAAREVLMTKLKKLARYLEVVADEDLAVLASTGYELRKDGVRNASAVAETLPPPDGFKLDRGPLSGTIVAKARRLPGAGSYEVQIAQADPTVETNWSDAGTFMRCSKIELQGLAPGKTISVRMRGIGSRKPGAWTPAASLMVV